MYVILSEKVHKKTIEEVSSSDSTLSVEGRGKIVESKQDHERSKSKRKSKSTKQRVACWNYGKIRNLKKECWAHLKKK